MYLVISLQRRQDAKFRKENIKIEANLSVPLLHCALAVKQNVDFHSKLIGQHVKINQSRSNLPGRSASLTMFFADPG